MTKEAIDKARITATALLLIIVLGLKAYMTLPRSEDPGFIVREAQVWTLFPGASPERVENLVTDSLESAIQEIPEIDYITSKSSTGTSVINVRIQERYTEMRPIWDSLRRKVEREAPDLPEGTIGPFINDEFGDVFGTIVTVTGDGFNNRELNSIASSIRSELLKLDDVAKVEKYGEQKERIWVEYNNSKLAKLGTSSLQVQQILKARNILSPGGSIFTDKERIILEPTGNYNTLEDIENTLLVLPRSGEVVYLKDLATVKRGYIDPPQNLVRSSGIPAIALAISLRDEGNVIRLGEEVKKILAKKEEINPVGVQFDIVAFQPKVVEDKVDNFVENLIQSVVIVMISMLFFLGVRTGLIVSSLIPMSILASLICMQYLHIGIDQISLASLIIALGMLVDNAIVMSESILTQMGEGKSVYDASIDSARELRVPLLTSSLTTSIAFLPIFLAHSIAGEYTASLFKVVTIALLASWLLSLTMIPMLCVFFLRKGNTENQLGTRYRTILLSLLRHPYPALTFFSGAFIVALYAFQFVPDAFFPPSDRTLINAELELPVGTKIEHTEKVVAEIEEHLKTIKGIQKWVTFVGGQAPRYVINYTPSAATPENTFIIINTDNWKHNDIIMDEIEHFIYENYPDLRVTLKPTETGPPVAYPIEIRISGDDQQKLIASTKEVKRQLVATGLAKGVHDDWGGDSKKLAVNINQARAQRAGITSQDVAVSLQTMHSGFQATQFRQKDKVIPITLRSADIDRNDIDKLETLNVHSQSEGVSVPLNQIADVSLIWQPNTIMRRNRTETVTIQADLVRGASAFDVSAVMTPWLNVHNLNYEYGGTLESSDKSRNSIYEQVPLAALIILLLLVTQFNSFMRPLIICTTIPLGIIGVVIGLLLTGYPMGFMAFLGIISLSGIVINNGIVLLDRIRFEQEEFGRTPQDAILEACQRRLRPIFLTTATTIGGLLPLWFGGGAMFQPMAVAIIFGLLFSTCLTLGFVPLLYALFYRIKFTK